METPAQKCARLVAALEDLVSQEAVCLGMCDFAAVVEIQERVAPIVEYLAAHAVAVKDEKIRRRIAAVLQRRQESCTNLSEEIERTREELNVLQGNQRRVALVAPVYGRAVAPRRRLSAVG